MLLAVHKLTAIVHSAWYCEIDNDFHGLCCGVTLLPSPTRWVCLQAQANRGYQVYLLRRRYVPVAPYRVWKVWLATRLQKYYPNNAHPCQQPLLRLNSCMRKFSVFLCTLYCSGDSYKQIQRFVLYRNSDKQTTVRIYILLTAVVR